MRRLGRESDRVEWLRLSRSGSSVASREFMDIYIYIYLSMRPSHRDFLPSPIPFIRSRCVIFSNEAKGEGEVLSNSLSGRLAVKIWQGEIAGGG